MFHYLDQVRTMLAAAHSVSMIHTCASPDTCTIDSTLLQVMVPRWDTLARLRWPREHPAVLPNRMSRRGGRCRSPNLKDLADSEYLNCIIGYMKLCRGQEATSSPSTVL